MIDQMFFFIRGKNAFIFFSALLLLYIASYFRNNIPCGRKKSFKKEQGITGSRDYKKKETTSMKVSKQPVLFC
jgi:hypothetical protein